MELNAKLSSPRFSVGREAPLIRERELLRVVATLGGTDPASAAKAVQREVLKWAGRQVGYQLPNIDGGLRPFEYLGGGRTCIGVGLEDSQRVLWALKVDRPDANVAQRNWTTEVVVGHATDGSPALFSLRLLVSTPETKLLIEPAVPGLVRQITSVAPLQHDGHFLDIAPWRIKSEDEAEVLVDALIEPSRTTPYIVCSLADGELRSGIHVELLAKATLGIARIVVVPAAHTWVLTQRLGKPLSVYNGAIRAYMPGFSYDANPYAHRLFLAEETRSEERSRSIATELRWLVANESLRRLRLGSHVVAFSEVREASLDIERERLKRNGSGDAEQLRAAQSQIEALKDDLRRSNAETNQWMVEYERADEQAQNFEQQLRGAQYRIQQLLEQIKSRGEEPDAGIPLPQTWSQFGDWCDKELSGRVALSGRARRETKSPDFEDPLTAARCLLWLANEYRDSRINGTGGDLRKPLEEGVHNDRCGADSFEIEWNSRNVAVEWHIKNGGNTRDPRRCLRIYYFWDEENQSIVVASMPAHVRTGAT